MICLIYLYMSCSASEIFKPPPVPCAEPAGTGIGAVWWFLVPLCLSVLPTVVFGYCCSCWCVCSPLPERVGLIVPPSSPALSSPFWYARSSLSPFSPLCVRCLCYLHCHSLFMLFMLFMLSMVLACLCIVVTVVAVVPLVCGVRH